MQDRSRTILKRRRALDEAALSETLRELRASIEEAFSRSGVAPGEILYEYFLDLQYYGQVFSLAVGLDHLATDAPADRRGDGVFRPSEEGSLSIPLNVDPTATGSLTNTVSVTSEAMEAATERFHQEHEREYGHSDRDQEVQVVHARVFGRHQVTKPTVAAAEPGGEDPSAALVGRRPVRFDGTPYDAPAYDRLLLRAGNVIDGPAVIDERSSTTALPPGTTARVDRYGNLLLEIG